jgi:hypothetical protein
MTMAGNGFPTHIALKREEHERLLALGKLIGADLSPRQVVLWMLKREEARYQRIANKLKGE